MYKGIIQRLLKNVYEYLGLHGKYTTSKQRIIRIRISMKTGLSMNEFSETSTDSPEDLQKIINALQAPEFGLAGFPFKQYYPGP